MVKMARRPDALLSCNFETLAGRLVARAPTCRKRVRVAGRMLQLSGAIRASVGVDFPRRVGDDVEVS
jgi:hypothetical protein